MPTTVEQNVASALTDETLGARLSLIAEETGSPKSRRSFTRAERRALLTEATNRLHRKASLERRIERAKEICSDEMDLDRHDLSSVIHALEGNPA